ncbi:MAG: CPBP family intramembrane glutamic endopeptidase [Ferruginibacter sp.]
MSEILIRLSVLEKLKRIRTKPIGYIVLFIMALIIIEIMSGAIIYLMESYTGKEININNDFNRHSMFYKFIVGCIVGPVIETYIFQLVPYNYLRNKNVKTPFIILFSSLLFSFVHYYSIPYIITTFFIGILLISAYAYWQGTKPNKFIIVCLIHSFHNILVLLFS